MKRVRIAEFAEPVDPDAARAALGAGHSTVVSSAFSWGAAVRRAPSG